MRCASYPDLQIEVVDDLTGHHIPNAEVIFYAPSNNGDVNRASRIIQFAKSSKGLGRPAHSRVVGNISDIMVLQHISKYITVFIYT